MRRKTLDVLLTTAGLVVAGILLIAGGLLAWGHNFTSNEVHSQLAAQQIFFPKPGSEALNDPAEGKPRSRPAAGQALPGEVRRAAAGHRPAGQGLRGPLHRRAPQGSQWRQDLLPVERRGTEGA